MKRMVVIDSDDRSVRYRCRKCGHTEAFYNPPQFVFSAIYCVRCQWLMGFASALFNVVRLKLRRKNDEQAH